MRDKLLKLSFTHWRRGNKSLFNLMTLFLAQLFAGAESFLGPENFPAPFMSHRVKYFAAGVRSKRFLPKKISPSNAGDRNKSGHKNLLFFTRPLRFMKSVAAKDSKSAFKSSRE